MTSDPNPTTPDSPDLVDVEEYAKASRDVPNARQYQIRVDRERYVVDHPILTGRQILALAGKTPELYLLHQRLRGGVTHTVGADDKVDLRGRGPERFMTMKRETQEGYLEGRRAFRLAAADEVFLNATHPEWETVMEGKKQWVVIHSFGLPAGYASTAATLAVELVAGYPESALDMAYFHPPLQRADSKPIPNLSSHEFDGRKWQRWSRHRTAVNAWNPDTDCLATHVSYVGSFLRYEFEARP